MECRNTATFAGKPTPSHNENLQKASKRLQQLSLAFMFLSLCAITGCGPGITHTSTSNANQPGQPSTSQPSSTAEPLTIQTSGLPGGSIGAGYSSQLNANGGVAPYKWSMLSGALPPGVSLNEQSGAIAGVPSQTGSFSAVFQVADSSETPQTTSKNLAFEVATGNSSSGNSSSSNTASQAAFYGSGINGDALGNLQVGASYGYQVSYRFLANHTGTLGDVRFYLITDGPHAGYNAGTGGALLIQLETDDGTDSHNPSGQVMASYTITHPSQAFPDINFSPAPTIQQGNLYHLVFSNTDPNPAANYVSVDDIFTTSGPNPAQPTMSNTNFAALEKSSNSSWYQVMQFTPIVGFDYTDGASQGCGYIEMWSETPEPISGAAAVREQFTVSGPNMAVTKIAMRVARMSGSGDLTVKLEQADGTVIEQGTIPASSMTISSTASKPNYTWVTYNFSEVRTLFSGQAYNLVFQSADGSMYQAFPIRKGNSENFTNSTYFPDGYAQFTQDGSTWTGWNQWGVTNRQDGDLQFYFTVVP